MSEQVPADQIEGIVGAPRHPTRHYARADSSEQVVYVLHSMRCREQRDDLRDCLFSQALDNGISAEVWAGLEDAPVRVTISRANRLIPAERAFR